MWKPTDSLGENHAGVYYEQHYYMELFSNRNGLLQEAHSPITVLVYNFCKLLSFNTYSYYFVGFTNDYYLFFYKYSELSSKSFSWWFCRLYERLSDIFLQGAVVQQFKVRAPDCEVISKHDQPHTAVPGLQSPHLPGGGHIY